MTDRSFQKSDQQDQWYDHWIGPDTRVCQAPEVDFKFKIKGSEPFFGLYLAHN